ncbi:MAG: hypothetical protein DRO88_14245 [Promethearchaeia archaeon]|nr:MAG: hypothetical protein DRO88_14245 [Candidatus Lokiarchaeia archaeon]
MVKNLIKRWTTVEKPKVERVYLKGKPIRMVGHFLLCFALGLLTVWLMASWDGTLHHWPDGRYAFESWAFSYFVRFFLMVIPIGVSMTINSKSKTPAYGFSAIGGFFAAALTFIAIEPYHGLYMAFVVSLAILGNIPSQGDFSLKWYHLLYYFLLGIYACYFNTVYQMLEWDVWVWLQMIHVHLFVVIIAAVKIRQWSYMYMFGWAFAAIITYFLPTDLFIFRLPGLEVFPIANLKLAAGYNLLVPPMLTVVIMYYFFNIQRKVEARYIGMDK